MSSTKKRNLVQGKGAPRYWNTPVARFLRQIKELESLTDKQIAEKIGAHYQNVQDWRTGKARPHRTSVRHIAAVFGGNEADLTAGLVREKPMEFPPRPRSQREKRILNNVEKLFATQDEELIDHIDRQIKILVDRAQGPKSPGKQNPDTDNDDIEDDPNNTLIELKPI